MSVELLVVYTSSAAVAWDVLGDEAGLFGDNGGDPDGPSYYRPTTDLSDDSVNAIVANRLGHIEVGEQVAYERNEDGEYERLDGNGLKGWCGYQTDSVAYLIRQ
mgnify:CR=1 FL=1